MSHRAPSADTFGWLVAALAWPWCVHALVVLSSALGMKPLGSTAPALGILVLACGVAAWLARIELDRQDARDTAREDESLSSLRTLWILGLCAFGLSLCSALLLPVVAYDALGYRLPVIAQWLDAGRIAWVHSDDAVRNGYPLGQEAVSAVLAAVSGKLHFAAATSFMYVAQGALAVGWLAQVCGVRRALARAAMGVFLLVPMTLLNAPSAYVDAAFAGATVAWLCTLCAFACSPREAGQPTRALAIAAGMAAAHVLSLKGTGLPFVIMPAAVCVARAAFVHRAALGRPRSWPLAQLAWFVACASPGAFWVVRNVIHTGNPLWPVSLSIAGHTLPGVGTMEQVLDVAHNVPPVLRPLSEPLRVAYSWLQLRGPALDYDDRLAGLGYTWPLFALPALLAFVWQRARRAPPSAAGTALTPIAWVLVLTGLCFLLQPLRWWPRYTLWLWGAGALALAGEAERLAVLGAGRARASRLLAALAGGLTLVASAEGLFALGHAQGAHLAFRRLLDMPFDSGALDVRRAVNAEHWVAPELWALHLEDRPHLCRGGWKPGTDNANLDGVFAQLSPRPQLHVVLDDDGNWPAARAQAVAYGCRELLLFTGSPVLASARRDPGVSVETSLAFDPLFVVNGLVERAEHARAPLERVHVPGLNPGLGVVAP